VHLWETFDYEGGEQRVIRFIADRAHSINTSVEEAQRAEEAKKLAEAEAAQRKALERVARPTFGWDSKVPFVVVYVGTVDAAHQEIVAKAMKEVPDCKEIKADSDRGAIGVAYSGTPEMFAGKVLKALKAADHDGALDYTWKDSYQTLVVIPRRK
jgi:hypothetical protein